MPHTPSPRSKSGTPSRSRRSPIPKNLKENSINIDRAYRPKHVLNLTSQLLTPFSKVIPESKFSQQWGGREIQRDAVDWDASPESTKAKEAMLNAARMINQKYQKKMESPPTTEIVWDRFWADIFENRIEITREYHGLKSRPIFAQLNDITFLNTGTLYDNEECVITWPKPDATLAFRTCNMECQLGIGSQAHEENYCFSQKTLEDLQGCGLITSPFKNRHNLCFPWGIFEGKLGGSSRLKPECQAANAAVKCIKLLEKLLEAPDSPSNHRIGPEDVLPIPCITGRGKFWELWVCYRGKDDFGPTYKLEHIFEGDLSDLWSCVQLVYILDRLKDWALNTFRPWIHEQLKPWIEKSLGGPRGDQLSPSGKNVKSPTTRRQETGIRRLSHSNHEVSPIHNQHGSGLSDSGISLSYGGDGGGDGSGDGSGDEVTTSNKNSKEMLSWHETGGTADQGGLEHYLGDIPEIETVLGVGRETSCGLQNTKPKSGLLYRVRWKDCWSTEEYIAKFPGRYRVAATLATKKAVWHRTAVELKHFRFIEQWVRRESFDDYELNIIHSWELIQQSLVDKTSHLRI